MMSWREYLRGKPATQEQQMKWTAMYAQTKQAASFVAEGNDDEVVEQVTKAFPQHTLEFEAYTDQVDVFVVNASGRRRKLLALQPQE